VEADMVAYLRFVRAGLADLVRRHPLPWHLEYAGVWASDGFLIAWITDPMEAMQYIDFAENVASDLEE
jgi:hypothetical protein